MTNGTEVLPGYPRPLSDWGMEVNIDAVLSIDDNVYFFKDQQFWLYNDLYTVSVIIHKSENTLKMFYKSCFVF